MRTLALNEVEQVGGGLLPGAIVPLAKLALPYVTPVVTAVTSIGLAWTASKTVSHALDKASELCSEGSDAQVKSAVVDLSCTAKKDGQSSHQRKAPSPNPPSGLLKAMMPEDFGS